MTPYVFQRGETISLAIDAVSGDPVTVTAATAQLKAVPPGRTTVPAGVPIAATFDISPRAAAGEVPAGWNLTISAVVSSTLSAGSYLADAKFVVASGVVITDSVALRIRDAVTS